MGMRMEDGKFSAFVVVEMKWNGMECNGFDTNYRLHIVVPDEMTSSPKIEMKHNAFYITFFDAIYDPTFFFTQISVQK